MAPKAKSSLNYRHITMAPLKSETPPTKYRANILLAISVRTTQKRLLLGGMSLVRRR